MERNGLRPVPAPRLHSPGPAARMGLAAGRTTPAGVPSSRRRAHVRGLPMRTFLSLTLIVCLGTTFVTPAYSRDVTLRHTVKIHEGDEIAIAIALIPDGSLLASG